MRKKRFSVEQMIGVLKQAEVGVPVAELIRKAGISEQTFYRWKSKYAGLEVDQVRQMAQLQEENLRLKKLVAELSLDKTMLQDVLSKKGSVAIRALERSKTDMVGLLMLPRSRTAVQEFVPCRRLSFALS
jgi:putative transposase